MESDEVLFLRWMVKATCSYDHGYQLELELIISMAWLHSINRMINNPIPLVLNTPQMVPIMWKFPTKKNMVSKGVFSMNGMINAYK